MTTTTTTDREAEQTLLRFIDCLDQNRYPELLSLMTDDAVWHRQGRALRGQPEIGAALQARSPTQRVRHLVSNLLQHGGDDESLQISFYMTALRFDDGQPAAGPARIAAPFNMSRVTNRLVRQGARWLIAEQAITTEFVFEPDAAR